MSHTPRLLSKEYGEDEGVPASQLSVAVISDVYIHLLTTSKERSKMESTYKEINSNQDGYLSFEELKKGYKKIHGRMTEETIGIFE